MQARTIGLRSFSSMRDLVLYFIYNVMLPGVLAFVGYLVLQVIERQLSAHAEGGYMWLAVLSGFVDALLVLTLLFWFLAGGFTFVVNCVISVMRNMFAVRSQ